MANRIQIRHGSSQPGVNSLLPYELGWHNGALYIGNPTSGELPINIMNNLAITITANATGGYWNLTGTNGTNAVTYALAPYSSKTNSACFYTGTDAPDGTTRLNYNGYLYATKLYSGGTEVLTTSGNAASATYATNVRITDTLPTTGTRYYLTFTTNKNADTNYVLRANGYIGCYISGNDAGGFLVVGDNSRFGGIQLNGGDSYHINLVPPTTIGANKTITLPNKNGTAALISDLNNYLPLIGGTLTGGLTINNSTQDNGLTVTSENNTNISVTCTNQTYNTIQLRTGGSTGHHGIYSLGYGSNNSGKWIIYRSGSDGKVYLQNDLSGNIVWSDKGRRIFVQTGTTVPSGAVNGDIVLVKV